MYNLWVLSYTLPINDIVNTPIKTITDKTNIPILPMPDELRICVLYSRCNTITPEELPNKIDEYTYKQNDVSNYNSNTVIENVTRVLTDFKTSLQSLITIWEYIHTELVTAIDIIGTNNTDNMYTAAIRKHIHDKYKFSFEMKIYITKDYSAIKNNSNLIINYIDEYIKNLTTLGKNNNNNIIPIFDNFIKGIYNYICTYIVILKKFAYDETKKIITNKSSGPNIYIHT